MKLPRFQAGALTLTEALEATGSYDAGLGFSLSKGKASNGNE